MKSGALAQLFVRGLTRMVTAAPVLTLIIIAFLTSAMYFSAVKFEENMTRDIEVYLPEGEESSGLLLEVRDEWSTDTLLVIVETRNAIEPETYSVNPRDNVTFVDNLKEMSELEVAIDSWGQGIEQVERPVDKITCLEAEKGPDKGKCDGIVFTLSLSSIIKELNSTTPRFTEAVENKAGGETFRRFLVLDDEPVNDTAKIGRAHV